MDARDTLKLISKQWCNLDDLMKLAEIGKELGITKERARQIKVFAMRKLRSEALATISCMV